MTTHTPTLAPIIPCPLVQTTVAPLQRHRVARLLGSDEYDRLLGAGNVATFVEHLADSPYRDAVALARTRQVGMRVVVDACRLHLGAALRSLRRLDGANVSALDIVLARWDAVNLRNILRAQRRHAAVAETLLTLVPGGELGDEELTELAATSTPAELLAALRGHHAIYAAMIAAAMRDSRGDAELDDALAARFHDWRLDAAESSAGRCGAVRSWLAVEADAHNLSVALRSAGGRRLYVRGGSLDRVALERARRGDDDAVAVAIARAIVPGVGAPDDGSWLASALRWITEIEMEAEDVRWIAAGVEQGWTRREIAAGLLVPRAAKTAWRSRSAP